MRRPNPLAEAGSASSSSASSSRSSSPSRHPSEVRVRDILSRRRPCLHSRCCVGLQLVLLAALSVLLALPVLLYVLLVRLVPSTPIPSSLPHSIHTVIRGRRWAERAKRRVSMRSSSRAQPDNELQPITKPAADGGSKGERSVCAKDSGFLIQGHDDALDLEAGCTKGAGPLRPPETSAPECDWSSLHAGLCWLTGAHDPSRSTVVYVHGWQPGTTARGFRETLRWRDNTRHRDIGVSGELVPDVDALPLWASRGWNVAIFYWNQFADDNLTEAERKIHTTFGDNGNGMRWQRRLDDGTTVMCEAGEDAVCVADMLVRVIEPIWHLGTDEPGEAAGTIGDVTLGLCDTAANCADVTNGTEEGARRQLNPKASDAGTMESVQSSTVRDTETCRRSSTSSCDRVRGRRQKPPGRQLRLVGHSLGAQLVLEAAGRLLARQTPKLKKHLTLAEIGPDPSPLRIVLIDPYFTAGAKAYLPHGRTPVEHADVNLLSVLHAMPSLPIECYRASILGDPPACSSLLHHLGAPTPTLHELTAFSYVIPPAIHPLSPRARHIAAFNLYFLSIARVENPDGEWDGHMHPGASDSEVRRHMLTRMVVPTWSKLIDSGVQQVSATRSSSCHSSSPLITPPRPFLSSLGLRNFHEELESPGDGGSQNSSNLSTARLMVGVDRRTTSGSDTARSTLDDVLLDASEATLDLSEAFAASADWALASAAEAAKIVSSPRAAPPGQEAKFEDKPRPPAAN